MLFHWEQSKGVKSTHGYRSVLDLLLCLCNTKNTKPQPHVDMLWSILPQLLSFLCVDRKFIAWVVFHSHGDLTSFSQI